MDTAMVLTLIGNDRPGVVKEVAQLIAARQGLWLKSEFSSLSGKLAGIVEIAVPTTQSQALVDDLQVLESAELRLLIAEEHPTPTEARYPVTLRFVGMDRRGVVTEISSILTHYGATIHSLSSHCAPAPMSGDILFQAVFQVHVPATVSCPQLCEALEALQPDLMVDWESQTALAI